MSVVKLSTAQVLTTSFTRAVARIAEARQLSKEDHDAAINLIKRVRALIEDLRSEKLSDDNAKDVAFEGCSLSGGVIAKAGLSPSDTIALGPIIQGG